jgi:serine/threonine-protein kinase
MKELPAPPASAPVAPFSGRVVVHTSPPGARLFLDGRDRGTTPVSIAGLGQGEHRVRILRDGYTTVERRVALSPSQPSQAVMVPLVRTPVVPKPAPNQPANADAVSPKPGSSQPAKADAKPLSEAGVLVLDSRPTGATAFVDGRAVGRTPLTLPDMRAGDHSVRFELDEHHPWTASIKVIGGTTNRVGGSLEKID